MNICTFCFFLTMKQKPPELREEFENQGPLLLSQFLTHLWSYLKIQNSGPSSELMNLNIRDEVWETGFEVSS